MNENIKTTNQNKCSERGGGTLLTSKLKRVLSLVLATLMIVAVLPLSSFAVTEEKILIGKGKLDTSVRLQGYQTNNAPITNTNDKSWASIPRQFKLENITWHEDYDTYEPQPGVVLPKEAEINVAYCINHGASFKNKILRNYYGYMPVHSDYFNNLGFTEGQQKGLLLVAAYGYNGKDVKKFGTTNPNEAIAATQALMWEFNVGTRTGDDASFEDDGRTGEKADWAFSMLKGKEGALNAYYHILASIRTYLEDNKNNPDAWKEDYLSNPGMIIWEQSDKTDSWEPGSAQVVITYSGTPVRKEFGSIEIKKTDEDGKSLNGAKFDIYKLNNDGTEKYIDTLITGADGVAITEGGKTDPSLEFGTYRIEEMILPEGYIPVGPTEWTVVIGKEDGQHQHIQLHATNRPEVYVSIKKYGEADDANVIKSLIHRKTFVIYDYNPDTKEVGKERLRMTTAKLSEDKDLETGETVPVSITSAQVLPTNDTGYYVIREVSDGPYYCYYWDAFADTPQWKSQNVEWVFSYEDVRKANEANGNTIFEISFKNVQEDGYASIKKVVGDETYIEPFEFVLSKNGEEAYRGTTLPNGYLASDAIYRQHLLGSYNYRVQDVIDSDMFGDFGNTQYLAYDCSKFFFVYEHYDLQEFLDDYCDKNNLNIQSLALANSKTGGIYTVNDTDSKGSRIFNYRFSATRDGENTTNAIDFSNSYFALMEESNEGGTSGWKVIGIIICRGTIHIANDMDNEKIESFIVACNEADYDGNGIDENSVDVLKYIEYLKKNKSLGDYNIDILKFDFNMDNVIDQKDIDFYESFKTAKKNAPADSSIRNADVFKSVLLNLQPGTYTVEEVLTDEQKDSYVAPLQQTIVIKSGEVTDFVFENFPNETYVQINKTSDDGIVEGFYFEVTQLDASSNVKRSFIAGPTDVDGSITMLLGTHNDDVKGKYIVKELGILQEDGTYRIPGRYNEPPTDSFDVTELNKIYSAKFHNSIADIRIEIIKKAETYTQDGNVYGGDLENILFTLYGYDFKGNFIERNYLTVYGGYAILNSDDTGKRFDGTTGVILDTLPIGDYIIEEVGYVYLDEDGKYVIDEERNELYIKPAPIEIHPRVDDEGNVTNNEASFGKDPVSVTFENKLKYFELELIKKDSTGQPKGYCSLEGAIYGLYLNGVLVDTATTDNTGYAKFSKRVMEIGYTVQEISAPHGYYLDPTVYDIDTNPANYAGDYEHTIVTLQKVVEEEPIMGSFTIYKEKGLDEDNENYRYPEEGAVFEVYLESAGSYDNASDDVRCIMTTDGADPDDEFGYDGGMAYSKELPYGTYIVHQISGEDGYGYVADFKVEINKETIQQPIHFDLFNTQNECEYGVKKTDQDGNALEGAIFQMQRLEGNEYVFFAEATSDANGIAKFTKLPFGSYKVIETKAPAGYALSAEVKYITVDKEWENKTEGFDVEWVNNPTKIELEKQDITTAEGIPGAEITIYNEDGSIFTSGITDENGKFTIYNIPAGHKYTFKETYAPEGYQINTTVFEFEILEDGTIIGDTLITDKPTEWTITKTDITGEKTLPGATIAIYDEQGNEVFRDVTDEDGTITATYLKPGKYTFKEIYACDSYALNVGVFEFEIDEKGNIAGDDTITDELTKLEIFKTNELGEAMEGVKFGVYDINGDLVMEGATDEDGYLAFVGLTHNDYVVKEISTWDGYMLDPNSYAVKIDGEWVNGSDEAILNIVNHPVIETGDNNNMLWYIVFAIVSVIGIVFLSRKKYSFGV